MQHFKCFNQVLSFNNIYLLVCTNKKTKFFNKTFFKIKIINCILIILKIQSFTSTLGLLISLYICIIY